MAKHSPISVLLVDDSSADAMRLLVSYLRDIPHLQVDKRPQLPGDLSGWSVVITAGQTLSDAAVDRLTDRVRAGGGWLTIIGRNVNRIPALFGAEPAPVGPFCELRVLFDNGDHPPGRALAGCHLCQRPLPSPGRGKR